MVPVQIATWNHLQLNKTTVNYLTVRTGARGTIPFDTLSGLIKNGHIGIVRTWPRYVLSCPWSTENTDTTPDILTIQVSRFMLQTKAFTCLQRLYWILKLCYLPYNELFSHSNTHEINKSRLDSAASTFPKTSSHTSVSPAPLTLPNNRHVL